MATNTWTITDDAYIDQSNPTVNYGSSNNVVIGMQNVAKTPEYRGFFRVDFSSNGPPDSASVTLAKLYTYGTAKLGDPSDRTWWAVYVNGAWAEVDDPSPPPFGVTWNTMPSTDPNYKDTFAGLTAVGAWESPDVTTVVKRCIDDNSSVFDCNIKDSVSGVEADKWWQCNSREGGLVSSTEPYLEITWTVAGGAPRSHGYVMGSRMLEPEPPRGWQRQGLQGLLVPA